MLGILAGLMKGKTVRKVFRSDGEGLISGSDFIATLKKLGMQVENENLYSLMAESLQSDRETEEVVIELHELEEILRHYGVSKRSSGSSSEK